MGKTVEDLQARGLLFKATEFEAKGSGIYTGVPDIDLLLKPLGGWPKGITHITGPSGVGKSLFLALTAEHTLDDGVQTLIVAPESIGVWEQHLDLRGAWVQETEALDFPRSERGGNGLSYNGVIQGIHELIDEGNQLGVICIDSLDALITTEEALIREELGHVREEMHNQRLRQFLASLNRIAHRYHIPIIMTGHDYEQPEHILQHIGTGEPDGESHLYPMGEYEREKLLLIQGATVMHMALDTFYYYPGVHKADAYLSQVLSDRYIVGGSRIGREGNGRPLYGIISDNPQVLLLRAFIKKARGISRGEYHIGIPLTRFKDFIFHQPPIDLSPNFYVEDDSQPWQVDLTRDETEENALNHTDLPSLYYH